MVFVSLYRRSAYQICNLITLLVLNALGNFIQIQKQEIQSNWNRLLEIRPSNHKSEEVGSWGR